MSVKWKNFKVIFRKSNGINDPITDVQVPMVFDLIDDPGEHFNLWELSLDMGWVIARCSNRSENFSEASRSIPTSEQETISRATNNDNMKKR